jgi:phage tail sheath protein FI
MRFEWVSALFRRLFWTVDQRMDRIRQTIFEMTQWVVFEPNAPETWRRIIDQVSDFLTDEWRKGELVGSKAEEAFSVSCSLSTMTQDDILSGRLIIEVGIAPVKPAEFVIFRIFQRTSEAQ